MLLKLYILYMLYKLLLLDIFIENEKIHDNFKYRSGDLHL